MGTAAFRPDGTPNLVGVKRPAGQAHLRAPLLAAGTEAGRPRAAAVGNAEDHEEVARYLERVEAADARLRQAQRDGMEDSWHEDA